MKYVIISIFLLFSNLTFCQIVTDTSASWSTSHNAIISLSLNAGKSEVFVLFENGNQINLKDKLNLDLKDYFNASSTKVLKSILQCKKYMDDMGYKLVASSGFHNNNYLIHYIFERK
jgi:hypothetical protein